MVTQLLDKAKEVMHDKLKEDQGVYKNLLKDLLVQGLIKLYEKEVTLRCRESDVDLLESVIDEAVSEYKQLMLD